MLQHNFHYVALYCVDPLSKVSGYFYQADVVFAYRANSHSVSKDRKKNQNETRNEVRQLLIDNTIHLVAEGGFERATTKNVTFCGGSLPDLKMNEVYIYRLFGSKEKLYEQTFLYLDKKLIAAVRSGSRFADGFEKNTKEKLYSVFTTAWKIITNNEESCRCYVRYYYSAYFKGKSQEQHLKLFEEMITRLLPIFKNGADAVSILHSVFTAVFDFAIRVYNGELENSEQNQDHIFNVLYCMIATYLKNS